MVSFKRKYCFFKEKVSFSLKSKRCFFEKQVSIFSLKSKYHFFEEQVSFLSEKGKYCCKKQDHLLHPLSLSFCTNHVLVFSFRERKTKGKIKIKIIWCIVHSTIYMSLSFASFQMQKCQKCTIYTLIALLKMFHLLAITFILPNSFCTGHNRA